MTQQWARCRCRIAHEVNLLRGMLQRGGHATSASTHTHTHTRRVREQCKSAIATFAKGYSERGRESSMPRSDRKALTIARVPTTGLLIDTLCKDKIIVVTSVSRNTLM